MFFRPNLQGHTEHQALVRRKRNSPKTRNSPLLDSSTLTKNRPQKSTPLSVDAEDVTDELTAYKLASLPFPGVFGVFYETDRPTKNSLEKKWIEQTREKIGNPSDLEVLQKTFDRMK